MPSRNVVRYYAADSFYHIYNRGVEKREIFLDNQDYAVFLSLFKRYLDDKPSTDSRGCEFLYLNGGVEVIAFCVMPNHYHILLYQLKPEAVTKLLRAVNTSYVIYFNKKYGRVGPLFQGKFKAVKIDDESYLQNMSRYIHRNPPNYLSWEWSSLRYWTNEKNASWIKPDRLNDMSPEKYLEFIRDNGGKPVLERIADISI